MSSRGNNFLIGFLVFSVLLFVVASLVRHDAEIDSNVDVQPQGTLGGVQAKETTTIDVDVDAADSLASTSASGTARGDYLTLASYDLEKPARYFKLPKRLREISGLAMLAGNRLFAHDDERGVVVEIGYRDGSIVKAFALGGRRGPVADDFEGIAAAKGFIYLVTSSGQLYEFGEGADGETVPYNLYATGIGQYYEIEGLAYDPDQRVLLLVSKNPKNPRAGGPDSDISLVRRYQTTRRGRPYSPRGLRAGAPH